MKPLYLSYANPDTWRTDLQARELNKLEWKQLRHKILIRDNFTCQYCNFSTQKHQIVHHIDGNPENNNLNNLETICPMCNLIHHSGQGCVVQGIVDLYKESKHNQNSIIQITTAL